MQSFANELGLLSIVLVFQSSNILYTLMLHKLYCSQLSIFKKDEQIITFSGASQGCTRCSTSLLLHLVLLLEKVTSFVTKCSKSKIILQSTVQLPYGGTCIDPYILNQHK